MWRIFYFLGLKHVEKINPQQRKGWQIIPIWANKNGHSIFTFKR